MWASIDSLGAVFSCPVSSYPILSDQSQKSPATVANQMTTEASHPPPPAARVSAGSDDDEEGDDDVDSPLYGLEGVGWVGFSAA